MAHTAHTAICIDNLQFDEGSSGTPRLDLMVKGLSEIGFEAQKSDIHVGLTPDQGKRIRYNAIAIAAPTDKVPPRMLTILDGKPEGIIQFHEFPGAGSIGDEKCGDLMAGFTKAPFYGTAYETRGIMKGAVLMSRAPTQPRVEYVSGLLQDVVAGLVKDMLNSNQHEIAKLNAQLATMADGDEVADLNALKERRVNKSFAINRVLVHAAEYFTAYAKQARVFDVRAALVELTGVLPRRAQPGDIINIARFYGREMHVLTVLQRAGDFEPITLNVLSTIWVRLNDFRPAHHEPVR